MRFAQELNDSNSHEGAQNQLTLLSLPRQVYCRPNTLGHVVRIADEATTIGGDVVYTVVIELDTEVPELRWGMSVEVEIDTGE